MGIVKDIVLLQDDQGDVLVLSYDLEDYEAPVDFILRDGSVSASQIAYRQGRSGMPVEYESKTLRDFSWDIYGENVVVQRKLVEAFIDRFDVFVKRGQGLYIFSTVKGSGKTLLACCLANEILSRREVAVKFATVSSYLNLLTQRDDISRESAETIREASLLILDDIGAETATKPWVDSAIFELINNRYTKKLPTIFTSNYALHNLKIDDRAIDRIHEMSVDIAMPEKGIRWQQADKRNREFVKDVLGIKKEPTIKDRPTPESS